MSRWPGMPGMDGINFVKAVKLLPAYKFTPIIMLTTESDETRKREGQAGRNAVAVGKRRVRRLRHQ